MVSNHVKFIKLCMCVSRVIGGGLSEPQPSKAAPGKYGQLPDPDAQSDVGSRVSTGKAGNNTCA